MNDIDDGIVRDDGGELEDRDGLVDWEAAYHALAALNKADTHEDVHGPADTEEHHLEGNKDTMRDHSTGGDVAEGRGLQTTPSTALTAVVPRSTPDAPVPVSSPQRVSESGKDRDVNNTRNEDSMGLEGPPATSTTSRTLNTDTTTSDRPVRAKTQPKKFDPSEPLTRATCG